AIYHRGKICLLLQLFQTVPRWPKTGIPRPSLISYHFISWSTNMFGPTERNEAHTVFYSTLYIFRDDPMVSQEILEVVRNLLLNKKISGKKGRKPLADTSNLQEEIIKKPAPPKSDSSASLRKIHGYEITGQWHLEQVCDDGDYHYLYCDLTIKKPNSLYLEALLELLATASISKLDGNFEQVFKYEEQLHPREIWIVHFSCEDYIVTNLYWPPEKLQEKGLNVVHFWYDRDFKNVRMSARFWDTTDQYCEIIDEIIL
ncbi:14375_t:CDS:2, partial [Funneliformis mosseae]